MRKILSSIFLIAVVFTVNVYSLPKIVILATGGTIAGSAETNVQSGYQS
jgi:L-asparaginase/Glu-tRNA(Gln) amidotransferase subunit D